jgi:hypothetical protein
MATFISIHIKSDDKDKVIDILKKLSNISELTKAHNLQELDSVIIIGENSDPTYLAITGVKKGWITVHVNSFKKMHLWLKTISQDLNTIAINIAAQTTSDVYYFLMYDNGSLRREIEIYYGDLENAIDRGDKFAFENKTLVPEDDDDYENLFDLDTLNEYCIELGFALFDEEVDNYEAFEEYLILKSKRIGKTITDLIKGKPWWKFW